MRLARGPQGGEITHQRNRFCPPNFGRQLKNASHDSHIVGASGGPRHEESEKVVSTQW